MTITPACLLESVMLAAGDNVVYTVPSLTTVIIDKFTLTNTDGSSRTVNVNVLSGGAAGAANLVLDAVSISPSTCRDCTEMQNQILAAGDQISCNPSAGSVVSIRISGRKCV